MSLQFEMETWKDLIAGRISAQNLAKKTVSVYKDNKDAGLIAVTQWIIDACGCKCKVQTVESIPDLPEQMEKDLIANGGFPVLEKKTSAKLRQLMKQLIKKCEHSVLYDGVLIRILCNFLCKLSRSEIRDFRSVSTWAGLSVASELAELCHNLEKQKNNVNKQLLIEKDFTVEREVSRQESLTSSLSELSENLQEANVLMKILVQGILNHRIRDVSSKIRLTCCEELKSWLEEYPEIFVTDDNMEILYVLMFDSVKNIRMLSLKDHLQNLLVVGLHPTCLVYIYGLGAVQQEEDSEDDPEGSKHIIESLLSDCSNGGPRQSTKKFLSYCKERLLAMTLQSPEIAVQAVKVLALVDKFCQSLLNEKDKEQLYSLVFTISKKVAQEAAAYILQVSRTLMEEEGSNLLEYITCFFMEFDMQFHCRGYEILYVDSLWDICKELCDWKEFIECFLRQNDANKKITCLRILVSCIHRAVTGETPRGKMQKKFKEPIMTVKRSKSKMMEGERRTMTEVFMDYLPEIIKRNMEEEIILIEVLKIPLYMQTEVYGCNINQKPLEELLDILEKLFLCTNDNNVLDSIAKVYDLLNSPEVATFSMTSAKCAILMGTIEDATKRAMQTYQDIVQLNLTNDVSEGSEFLVHGCLYPNKALLESASLVADLHRAACHESMPPVEVIYETEKWTKKLCYLSKCIDIRSDNICGEMKEFIDADISQSFPVPEEVMCNMLWSCFHQIKMSVKKSAEANENSATFKNLLDDLQKFIQQLSALMSSSSRTPTQKEAFNIFCDLVYFLHVFCIDCPNLADLIYKPDGYMEDKLVNILEEWVFVLPGRSEDSVVEITLDECKRMLRGYWDLLTCHALSIECVKLIFMYYTKFPQYEDYLQKMLQVLLKFDSVLFAEILVNVLWSLYHGHQTSNTSANLKEMASKFAAMFDTDSTECREGVIAVQKKAINYIRQHEDWSQYINFLENFTDFAQITHASDVDDMLNYLQQNIPMKGQHHTRESAPFSRYVSCLRKVKKNM